MDNSALQYDTDVLKDRDQEVYSSLADINDIPIFTTEFSEKINKGKVQEKKQDTLLYQYIFINKMVSADTDAEVVSSLFQDDTAQMVKESEQVSAPSQMPFYTFSGITAVLFLGVVVVYIKKRNQKMEDNQHYE